MTSCILRESHFIADMKWDFLFTAYTISKQMIRMKNFIVALPLTLINFTSFCQEKHAEIHQFIDAWHNAAANADAKIFFNSMAEDAVYIGTDASERWSKTTFITFAKPYFDKGKAWSFKPYDRDLHVTNEEDFAWFSELLETWMGICRGSGMLRKTPTGWEIVQYHLSVTVPNEIIKDFITLVKEKENH
jgi:ketosteroid isomerase-like protein